MFQSPKGESHLSYPDKTKDCYVPLYVSISKGRISSFLLSLAVYNGKLYGVFQSPKGESHLSYDIEVLDHVVQVNVFQSPKGESHLSYYVDGILVAASSTLFQSPKGESHLSYSHTGNSVVAKAQNGICEGEVFEAKFWDEIGENLHLSFLRPRVTTEFVAFTRGPWEKVSTARLVKISNSNY